MPGKPAESDSEVVVCDQSAFGHVGCAASSRKRKRIEELFGWMKTVGGLRKTRHRHTDLVG